MIPDSTSTGKIIRAFHTPLNPNPASQLYYDNDVLDWKTLRPLYKHTPTGSVIYDYSKKGEVRLTFVKGKTKVYRSVKTNEYNYVLAGPGAGLLSACLPLKMGFKTDFSEIRTKFPYEPAFEAHVVNYTLAVIDEESVKINDKVFDTYIVEIDSRQIDQGVYYKSWVTKQAPHQALKFIYKIKNGNKDYKTGQPYVIRDIFVNCAPSNRSSSTYP
jgi:hypothetical protein